MDAAAVMGAYSMHAARTTQIGCLHKRFRLYYCHVPADVHEVFALPTISATTKVIEHIRWPDFSVQHSADDILQQRLPCD